jgi:hypothetical protein
MRKINILILLVLILNQKTVTAQRKWPIPLFFPSYGVYINLTNDINLNDTAKIIISQKIYFKLVLKNSSGESYCQVYRNNKIFEKGYYVNSLDTLKKYLIPNSNKNRPGKIEVINYFQPLKNGEWLETIGKDLVIKHYLNGVEISN